MPLLSPQTYLQTKSDPDEEKEPFFPPQDASLDNNLNPERGFWQSKFPPSVHGPTIPWLIVLFLLLSNIALYITHSSSHEVPWSPTDFIPARKVIEEKFVKFSSGLDFTDKIGHITRVSDPDELVYVGNSSDVDFNWNKLIMPDYIAVKITPEERNFLDEDLYLFPDGTYTIALSVFHDLHCLNTIRKRVYADMYPEMYPEMLKSNAIIHVDHCIDAMREMIMCRGDMTPIPVIWDERGQRDNPYFPIVHSCRNFDKLRGWMLERHDLH